MSFAKEEKLRVLLIGLDGFGTTLFKLLSEKYPEVIKNILRLKQSGVFSSLQSVLPTVTPCAWSSFITGRTAAGHNIYDFANNGMIANALSVKAKSMWSILREHGKMVGALHVPMSYPAEKINGFIIPGQFAPNISEKTVYPPSLYKKFQGFFKQYRPFFNSRKCRHSAYGPIDIDGFIEGLSEVVRKKAALNLMLMEEHPDLDLFISVFFESDTVQHYLWKFLDETHPLANKEEIDRYRPKILNFFKILDEAVGQIVRKFGQNSSVFLISDHGLIPFIRHFHTNVWLMKQNLLQFKGDTTLRGELSLGLAGLIERVVPFAAKSDPLAIYQPFIWRLIRKLKNIQIDYSRSKAFAYCENGIRINLKGREAQGTVSMGREFEDLRDEIIRRLSDLRDEQTKRPVVAKALVSEQAFDGPYLENAPDVIFIPSCGYWSDRLFPFEADIDDTRYKTAQHNLDGILIASGKGIKAQGHLQNARLVDILPSILSVLGIPLPKDIEGRALVEILDDSLFGPNNLKAGVEKKSFDSEQRRTKVYGRPDAQEANKIKKRLEGMGYI